MSALGARGRARRRHAVLVDTLLGTPFEIDTRGKILLLEDVNEEPPRIDRYLTHLPNARKLEACAGIWLPDFRRCVPRAQWPLWQGDNLTAEELLDELIVPLGVPASMVGESATATR